MIKTAAQDENFSEAEAQFDLNRLKTALVSQEAGAISEAPWRYFKGVLCGFETKEVAEKCHVTEKTVQVALNRDVKECLLRLLQRPDKERISNWGIVRQWVIDAGYGSGENQRIDWQEVCRGMLDRQIQSPTLNDLMAKDGICIDPNTLFVPVGLVERKQKQYRRSDIDSAEQGSQLLQPTEEEIVKRFDHEEQFFTQVICNPDIADGARLVITGEPGSGKTTLLQKIGDRLLKAEMFPIWISLGKQGVPPTYEFLSRVLKDIAQPQTVGSSDWDTNINALLQTGKVWLLLDGADELTVNGSPLHVIADQLREAWTNQVKVVLTCRLNAWDTQALPKFQVFRTLEFDYQTPVDDYPNQVEAYIHKFFSREATDSQLGNSLIQQLYRTGKERIRDSVKNPLRLSLLCYVWESKIGELPDTKAELYRLFVDYYYELQERKFADLRIDRTERDALNLALGEVAKAALDSKDSRFRLRKSLIESVSAMGQSDAKNSLFYKTIQLGWLNYIGTTAEKPHEAAYTFFHPTFQEYFAALAIDDWHFLFNHIPHDPRQGEYRIFELSWQEVILLWLGFSHNQTFNDQKDALIKALIDFDDNCHGLYGYRSYFLAVLCIGEFTNCSYVDEITRQLIEWAFGYFDSEQEAWKVHFIFSGKALSLIHRTYTRKVKIELLNLLSFLKDKELKEKIYRHNSNFYETLVIELSLAVLEIDSVNSEAVNTINEIVVNSDSDMLQFEEFKKVTGFHLVQNIKNSGLFNFFRKEVAQIGRQVNVEVTNQDNLGCSEEVINLFNLLADTKFTDLNHSQVLASLDMVILKNPDAFPSLISVIEKALDSRFEVDNYVLFKAVGYVEKIGRANSKAADILMQLILSDKNFGNYAIKYIALRSLISVGYGNQNVFDFLVELVHERANWAIHLNSFESSARYTAVGGLGGIASNHLFELVVLNLKDYFQSKAHCVDRMFKQGCYATLFRCAENMSYPDFFEAWHKPEFPINDSEVKSENSKY